MLNKILFTLRHEKAYFFAHGSTAPSGPLLPYYRGFTITLRHATLGSGLVTGPTQQSLPDNTQQSQEKDIHASGGIRTRDPNKRAAADPRITPRGHSPLTITDHFYVYTRQRTKVYVYICVQHNLHVTH
jgi:hypothetical protein